MSVLFATGTSWENTMSCVYVRVIFVLSVWFHEASRSSASDVGWMDRGMDGGMEMEWDAMGWNLFEWHWTDWHGMGWNGNGDVNRSGHGNGSGNEHGNERKCQVTERSVIERNELN